MLEQFDIGLRDKTPVAFQSIDLEGRIIQVNHPWEDLTGYSADEAVGTSYFDLVPEDHTADFVSNLALLMQDGELDGADCFIRCKSGRIRNILVYARVSEAEGCAHCVLIDITDFRRFERALGESESRFQALFDMAPTGLVIHDGRIIVMANRALARFLGYQAPEELVGRPLTDFCHPDDCLKVAERIKKMAVEDWTAPPIRLRFVRPGGGIAYGEVISSPIILGGQRVFSGVVIDLSEKLDARQALDESESRFRTLFEYSADPIVVHDNTVRMANKAALQAFGVPEESDLGALQLADFVHPDSLPIAQSRLAALLGGASTGGLPTELHMQRPDGGEWFAEAKSVPVTIKGERLLQTTFRDLTERKRDQAELERYRGQLEELLAERTESLARVREELDAVIAVVSRTVEMRDPYTAGHQRRVAVLAAAIARELGMSARDVEDLEVAGRLHDVGKVCIPTEILSKPSRLTTLEYDLVKTHVEAGYQIVSSADLRAPVAEIVRQHHERLDGSGYPRGLHEADLLMSAKVLMVADVVEAMSSHRPYRPSVGADAAIEEITAGSGVLYDPAVVDACAAVLNGGFDFWSVE